MIKKSVVLRSFLGYSFMVLSLAACVTINIYFPAAAAEEAARTIVRDVLKEGAEQSEEKAPEAEKQNSDEQSFLDSSPTRLTHAAESVLNFFIPAARAEQPNIDISSPSIRKLRASMSSRQSSIVSYYRSGALGFSNDGLVSIRELKAIPLRDRNKIKKLIADENGDRKALYAEIARANGHPDWEKSIRDIFARVWVEEAPKGYWYQNSKGGWLKK